MKNLYVNYVMFISLPLHLEEIVPCANRYIGPTKLYTSIQIKLRLQYYTLCHKELIVKAN